MEIISWDEAQKTRHQLIEMAGLALQVREKAYAPVSRFKVGALVAVDNPSGLGFARLWYAGCNVENAMLEVTHAEQAAIARMVVDLGTNPKPVISTVVVACTADGKGQHALPCGFCRQWIMEFGTPDTFIYGIRLASDGKTAFDVECTTLGELLPYAFKI